MKLALNVATCCAALGGLMALGCGARGVEGEPNAQDAVADHRPSGSSDDLELGAMPPADGAAPTAARVADERVEEAVAEKPVSLEEPIRVGAKPFTEQRILAAITAEVLSAEGLPVERGLESLNAIRQRHLAGLIDVYWEYTGTASRRYHLLEGGCSFDELGRRDAELRLRWLEPANFDNTFALVVRRESGWTTISELAAAVRRDPEAIAWCAEPEYYALADGLQGLEKAYGFSVPRSHQIASPISEGYQPLIEGRCDVLVGFGTDASLRLDSIRALEDDLPFFPEYRPAPVFRADVLSKLPAEKRARIERRLAEVAGALDRETMIELNAAVELDGRSPGEVAADFLARLAAEPPTA